jgi:hypothetical protein
MTESRWSASNGLYGIVGIVGALLLYWGLMSLMNPEYYASITVPWLDQTLRAASRHIWVLASGLLLLTVGLSPVITIGARSSHVAQVVIGVFGILFVCFGGIFTLFTLDRVAGVLFVSPLLLTGVILVAVALNVHGWVSMNTHPS